MKNFVKLTLLAVVLIVAACSRPYQTIRNGIIVKLNPDKAQGAKSLKVEFLTEKILRVTVSPDINFSKDTSLMVIQQKLPNLNIKIDKNADTIFVSSPKIKVVIIQPTGQISFLDENNQKILCEKENGGKWFQPILIEGNKYWSIQQVFNSDSNEAFYGLGQHQDGWMNYKGKDVELYQYNTKVSVPFLISSKKYGILWDNYSYSKFGDKREYTALSAVFKTYDENLKEGGLTAKYYSKNDKNKIFITRQEDSINYEFLPDLKNIPSIFPMDQGKVEWSGYIESDTSGLHKLRLYAAGYIKFWFDGNLIIDRWRQAWNPTPNMLSIYMEKGKKYPVRIDWDPDGGESYIGLRALSPLPDNQQNDLSLYSEVAKQIDYYFIQGNSIDEIISGYREITGKAPIMPKWALGFWQSRERYKTQDELLSVVAEYRKRNIPFDNIVLDWFYWPQDKWGSHDFDSSRFPDPVGMINKLHNEYHAQIMISVWGKFYKDIENYNKLNEKGYLYKKNIIDGRKDWVYPGYQSTFYDALNPDARKMFWEMMREKLYVKGIDAWWMDASEPDIHSNLPPEERKLLMNPTALGPGAQYFNAYPLCNAKGIYEGQRSVDPDKRVFILTRSAYAGQQRYAAATWSGDVGARWEELYLQIPAGLNFSVSGIPFWTTDIGGFAVERKYEQAQGEALEEWRERFTRWFQYGTFCPLFRVHGQFPYREIYHVAPENHIAYKSMVKFVEMRYRLLPYIYSLAAKIYFDNYTLMRPLIMDFPNDTSVYNINDQFMFGPSILVCPVYKYKERSRKVYLPAGTGWYDLVTGKYYEGGQIIVAQAPYEYIPLFIKAGSIIPVGPVVQYALQPTNEPIDLYIYDGQDASFELYFDDGVTYQYEKDGYARIPIQYSQALNKLTIQQAQGKNSDSLNQITFRIIKISKNLSGALFNGKVIQSIDYKGKAISAQL